LNEVRQLEELAAALVAARFLVDLGPRWARMIQTHLLTGLSEEELARIGYNKFYKKVLSLDALITFTIIWFCTAGPHAGPDDRAISMLNLKMMRPPWLTASALGQAARRALRLPAFLKPQITVEKFITSKRRHVEAGEEFALIRTEKIANSNSVAVYATEKLHALMAEFWKGQVAIMYRLTHKLDNGPDKRNQGDEEETGGG
jgi:hypothetical protein